MGIAPIPGIRGLGPASAPLVEREVQPPFALDRSDRMQDDAYQGSPQSTERGMEEEGAEAAEDLNAGETSPIPGDANNRVSFFA